MRRFLADGETPIGIYRKLARDAPGTFLLESAEQGLWSRYSIVGARSHATLTARAGAAHWLGKPPAWVPTTGDPLAALRDTVAALQTPRLPGLPPLTGGGRWWTAVHGHGGGGRRGEFCGNAVEPCDGVGPRLVDALVGAVVVHRVGDEQEGAVAVVEHGQVGGQAHRELGDVEVVDRGVGQALPPAAPPASGPRRRPR